MSWPKRGRNWQWTFYRLRHMFSHMGVHVRDGMFDRFFEATG